MDRIITVDITENFIKHLADYIDKNYISRGADISRLAFVFGGKRPSLFLKKELSEKIGKSYLPPEFFSVEEFIKYIVTKKDIYIEIPSLDDYFTVYRLAQELSPEILKNKETFRKFLPWAKEISKFIEHLDLELVETKSLGSIQKVASIGYDVPESINFLFRNIIKLREKYHDVLNGKMTLSRGMFYLTASKVIENIDFNEFDVIFFCNFFYLHKTEEKIIKTLYNQNKAVLFFQGGQDEWSVLKTNYDHFSLPEQSSVPEQSSGTIIPSYRISLYSAFDIHSQVSTAREILKSIKKENDQDLDRTVIVTPDADSLIPLLCESSSVVKDINVSMGYPLYDNPVYTLFKSIFSVQLSKRSREYYAKDYLKVITNPLVKNLRISPGIKLNTTDSSMITRIVVHKIEEVLKGLVKTKAIPTGMFVDLTKLERSEELYGLVLDELGNTVLKIEKESLVQVVKQLHKILFFDWEEIDNCYTFSIILKSLLEFLSERSPLESFPLNRAVVDLLFGMQEQLQNAVFKNEKFEKEDIFTIFEDSLEGEFMAFSGMPLKGLQVLGLLETRSLSFDNVIIMDVNESVLPKLRLYEPLIPRDIMAQLGLNLLEREEEIQRYYFKRLISSAKNVHLIYREGGDRQRSRFVEEIIWNQQKEGNSLDTLPISTISFKVEVLPDKREIKKEKNVLDYLKNLSYSASSLDTYLNCSLKFYYKYVLRLDENESELDEPEAVDVGNFVHEFLNEIFEELRNTKFSISNEFRNHFSSLLDNRFDECFKKRMDAGAFILKEVVNHRMNRFLDEEEKRESEVKEILGLEKQCNMKLELNGETFRFNGKIDRIDLLEDDTILVLDYKTGNAKKMTVKTVVSDNFEMTRDSITRIMKSLQLPLYLHFIRNEFRNKKLDAGLYLLKEPKLVKLFGNKEPVEQGIFDKVMELSARAIEHIICKEILNPDVPFSPDTKNGRFCEYCPFTLLCR